MALNRSPSKAKFSFPKNPRFKEIHRNNDINQYDLVDRFDQMKMSGEAKPFGSSLPDRFAYLGSKKKNPNLKHTYVSHDVRINNDSTMSSNSHKKYTFGVGRGLMQPMFTDEIRKNADKNKLPPGPGTYTNA
jgi:hypothetical protein